MSVSTPARPVRAVVIDDTPDIRELVVGLTRTHAFTHRAASPGEVLP